LEEWFGVSIKDAMEHAHDGWDFTAASGFVGNF
jgi:hypothetical protein